jgi:hypothetical protein
MNQSKINVFILEIDHVSSRFSRSSSEAFDDEMSTEARQEERSAQRSVRKDHDTMNVRRQVLLRHPVHLQVIDVYCRGRWKSLDAASGPAPERLAPTYGQAPCFPIISSTTGGVYSGLDPYTWQHIRIVKLVQGILIVTSILQPSTETSNSSSSATSPNNDSADDYPEIGGSTYEDPVEESRLIVMVAPP